MKAGGWLCDPSAGCGRVCMDFVRGLISVAFQFFDEANDGSVEVIEIGRGSDALVQVLGVEGAVAQGVGDGEDPGLDFGVGSAWICIRPFDL